MPPTIKLPHFGLPPMDTGVEPVNWSLVVAPLGGVETAEGTAEDWLDAAAGGPRDQAEVLGVVAELAGWFGGVEALLICVCVL